VHLLLVLDGHSDQPHELLGEDQRVSIRWAPEPLMQLVSIPTEV
jgi:hypothetical protein